MKYTPVHVNQYFVTLFSNYTGNLVFILKLTPCNVNANNVERTLSDTIYQAILFMNFNMTMNNNEARISYVSLKALSNRLAR